MPRSTPVWFTSLVGVLALVGCEEPIEAVPLHFDGPIAAAVLPADIGPWEVPTGYVANSRDGTIVPLDLKMGRLLTDDAMASFLRAGAIPTGQARLLSDVAVVPGVDGSVTLWATDSAFGQLLQAPYVTGLDDAGVPIEVEPTASEVTFVDADGSGDSPTITGLVVRAGFTTTEDWYIEYDGTRWWAKGSRSGTQAAEPVSGETYTSDQGEIELLLEGNATAGDRFEFTTDTGIREYLLDGVPTAVHVMGGRVYVSVASQPGRVFVYDGVSGEGVGFVDLGEGAQPNRMASAPDGRLFVADGALAQVWVLRFDQDGEPSTVPVETIATAAPVIDVAWQGGLDREDVAFDHLFVAAVGTLRVDVWDLTTGQWVDPNPYTPEAEGVYLGAPVTGLGASVGDVELLHETAWDARPRVPTVAVATADGFVFQLEGSTGCATLDAGGPVGESTDGEASYISLSDQGDDSDPTLWIDENTGYQVLGSSCGGVTRAETWTVTYDAATISWEVEGTLSGVQTARAYEDERYLSDDGSISFLISAGVLPATQGDRFAFGMDDGLLVFRGSDEDEDGLADPAWEYPGRPIGFETVGGPSGGGWDPVLRKQYMLLPVANTDIAARLHLDTGKTEVKWE